MQGIQTQLMLSCVLEQDRLVDILLGKELVILLFECVRKKCLVMYFLSRLVSVLQLQVKLRQFLIPLFLIYFTCCTG